MSHLIKPPTPRNSPSHPAPRRAARVPQRNQPSQPAGRKERKNPPAGSGGHKNFFCLFALRDAVLSLDSNFQVHLIVLYIVDI